MRTSRVVVSQGVCGACRHIGRCSVQVELCQQPTGVRRQAITRQIGHGANSGHIAIIIINCRDYRTHAIGQWEAWRDSILFIHQILISAPARQTDRQQSTVLAHVTTQQSHLQTHMEP